MRGRGALHTSVQSSAVRYITELEVREGKALNACTMSRYWLTSTLQPPP